MNAHTETVEGGYPFDNDPLPTFDPYPEITHQTAYELAQKGYPVWLAVRVATTPRFDVGRAEFVRESNGSSGREIADAVDRRVGDVARAILAELGGQPR